MSDEVGTSPSTPEQLPVTRSSKLQAALQEFVLTGESSQGELVAEFVGVVRLVHPGDSVPRYQVFFSEDLGTYREAELAAVLEDHSKAKRAASFKA